MWSWSVSGCVIKNLPLKSKIKSPAKTQFMTCPCLFSQFFPQPCVGGTKPRGCSIYPASVTSHSFNKQWLLSRMWPTCVTGQERGGEGDCVFPTLSSPDRRCPPPTPRPPPTPLHPGKTRGISFLFLQFLLHVSSLSRVFSLFFPPSPPIVAARWWRLDRRGRRQENPSPLDNSHPLRRFTPGCCRGLRLCCDDIQTTASVYFYPLLVVIVVRRVAHLFFSFPRRQQPSCSCFSFFPPFLFSLSP